MIDLLEQANFTRVDPQQFHVILTKESHYGLDLQVDIQAFEEIVIFYRGATTITEHRRDFRKAYMGWREVKVPVFQRLFILFKLKPFDQRVQEVMKEKKVDRKEAESIVRRLRRLLPDTVTSDYVYMKLFKNMPRSDVEMIFPNTKVKFRLFDKIKFGVTAGSGVGAGVVATASKIAIASNPYTLVMALAGLGGVAVRQATRLHQPAQPLHGGDGAQPLFPLHGRQPGRGDACSPTAPPRRTSRRRCCSTACWPGSGSTCATSRRVDEEIEQYLSQTFGIEVNFDVEDALKRLKQDGLVTELADGTLQALPPHEAALHIDKLWDSCLDQLPDMVVEEGRESDAPVTR